MSPRRGSGRSDPGGPDEEEAAAELEEAFDEELALAADEGGDGRPGAERRPNVLVRLFRGGTSFDFIGNRRWWFAVSALVIVIGLVSIGTRGFNWSIEFRGGQSWLVTAPSLTVPQATAVVEAAGVTDPTVVQLTNQITHQRQIQVDADLNSEPLAQRNAIEFKVQAALAKAAHTTTNDVSINDVGASWGSEVTQRAIEALIVFFIVVAAYISIRFEFKMAVAAIVAVLHDILVTAGIYSLTGFEVTPDTVVAVLTVLGYSLYDTVVVFDRIRENGKGLGASGRITYSDMVNLSMNQTLARSINTSTVAIMPVLSVLVIGSFVLGATTLKDFGLALVIGLTSGAYSSIFIASPLLAFMKERETRYTTIRQRLESRGERNGVLTPAAAAAMAGAGGSGGSRASGRGRTQGAGVIRPGAASASRRAAAGVPRGGASSAERAGARTSTPGPGPSRSSGSSNGGSRPTSAPTRPGGTRPPPRPRKGKGKKGKRR